MAKINFYFNDIPAIHIEQSFLREAINQIIQQENSTCGEISIIFCKDEFLWEMNKRFLKHDYYTDIITFDYSQETKISGELYISMERVMDNAKKFNEKSRVELARVIFHGILHLLGYNDKEETEIKVMKNKENFYLSFFDVS